MNPCQKTRRYLAKAAVVALSGGTTFLSCETRVKDSIVGGIRQVILSPEAANLVVQAFVPSQDTEEDSDE